MQDPSREYYEPFELRVFENIECEWPLFFCLSMLDFLFQGDKEAVEEYSEALEEVLLKSLIYPYFWPFKYINRLLKYRSY